MNRRYRQSRKIIVALSMAALFLLPLPILAETLPAEEDIGDLSVQVREIIAEFMAETIEIRLGYEYKNRFFRLDDRQELAAIAKVASDRLSNIIAAQQKFKQQIEDYHGSDWDSRFGATGLWRTLIADLQDTVRFKCEVDYYLALCADSNEVETIRSQILGHLGQSRHDNLLRARLCAISDSAEALALLDSLLNYAAADEIYFTAALTRLKFLPNTEPEQLKELIALFESGELADSFELSAKLAFLSRRFGSAGALEHLLTKWPQARPFIAKLIMADLLDAIEKDQFSENFLSPLEAECAIHLNRAIPSDRYNRMLENLLVFDKFRMPAILYAAGEMYLEENPHRAVNLFIEASRVQLSNESLFPAISAEKIAMRAGQIAYDLFVDDSNRCDPAERAISNYLSFKDAEFFQDYEYLYCEVLRSCGDDPNAALILGQIAARPGGAYAFRAQYDILTAALNSATVNSDRSKLLAQLKDFIIKLPDFEQHNDLRTEAIHSYCHLGVEVDEIYAPAAIVNLPEMLLSVGDDSLGCSLHIQFLLGRIVERIDQYESQMADFAKFVKDCHRLSLKFKNCPEHKTKTDAAIISAELEIFAASDEKQLLRIEKTLAGLAEQNISDNVELVRCRARLMMALRRYAAAAELWSKVASARQGSRQASSLHLERWWRAKIYELNCWAKLADTDQEKVFHSVEVLANASDIPPFWAARLEDLARDLR